MIQLLQQGCERIFDVIEVHQPARDRVHLALDGQPYKEGVSVQAGAFVSFGHVRQPMRCLKSEVFIKFHGATEYPGRPAAFKK